MRVIGVFALIFGFSSGFDLSSIQEQLTSGNFSSGIVGSLQNSSLGNLIEDGISAYNNLTNGGIDLSDITETISNSSLGELMRTGIEFINNITSNNSSQSVLTNYVQTLIPFLANATDDAKTAYMQLAASSLNSTIEQVEKDTNEWAEQYGLTAAVNEFVNKTDSLSEEVDQNSTSIISNLNSVLNKIKKIRNNKTQTILEMQSAIIEYVMSLDSQTQEIITILYKPLLPQSLQNSIGCTSGIIDLQSSNDSSSSSVLDLFSDDGSSISAQIVSVNGDEVETTTRKNKKNQNKKNKKGNKNDE